MPWVKPRSSRTSWLSLGWTSSRTGWRHHSVLRGVVTSLGWPMVIRQVTRGTLLPVWSTLIGPAPTLLRSHWSRASLVMLAPAILCHKEPARSKQTIPSRGLWMPELVLYDIRLLAQATLGKLSTNENAVM